MKITVVCDILGKEDNGTTIATMNFIRHLQKNHEVKILCCDETKTGLANYYVVPKKKFTKAINNFVISTGFALAKPDMAIVKAAVLGADVVHCFEPFALSMAAIKVARANNIPITAAVHLLPEHLTYYVHLNVLPFTNLFLYKYWWNHTYRFVDCIHYPTHFVKNIFTRKNRKANKIKSYVISNGIGLTVKPKQVDKPTEYKNKIVILSVGRFSPEKSQKTLIKAVAKSKYSKKIQLILAGQGQKEKAYRKLAEKLQIQPIFKRFKHNEIIDVINYSDLFVHPAILETEGISVLEAIACGKLVIVSNARYAAPKTFGLDPSCIFKARSSRDLAKKIDFWIEHPEQKLDFQNKNLERGKKFNIQTCMEQTEQMLHDAIEWHKIKNSKKKTKK